MNDPWVVILMTAVGLAVAKWWRDDYRAARKGSPPPQPLPGATPTTPRAITIAIAGALLVLALETAGEQALGIEAEQSRMTWLFACYTVAAAPVIEEVIFRGWLVFGRDSTRQWLGAFAMSLVFAAGHPFLWRWSEDGFAFTLGAKGWFSATAAFVASLWFYAARLGPWNPTRSLLPCFAAHAAKNAGVVLVKAATGFMAGAW